MGKICEIYGITINYLDDDYYTFVLSNSYTSFLQQWRKENINKIDDFKTMLGISYAVYRKWEKGSKMSRDTYKRLRDIFLIDRENK